MSVQDLKPNSQDIATSHLEKIHQLLADPYASRVSTSPESTLAERSTFSPQKYAIWVNSLWFLSLTISLTCAALATLLQQWARRYIRITQPPQYNPHKRARIRAFFSNGVEDLRVPAVVEALPSLLHLSLFLFFAGLLVYLSNTNPTVFIVVACWAGIFVAAYACITFMPISRNDSPYYTPLSSSALLLYAAVSYAVLQILRMIFFLTPFVSATRKHFGNGRNGRDRNRRWLLEGTETTEEGALKTQAEIDVRILKSTIDALDDDDAREKFFQAIPGFFSSNLVDDPQRILDGLPHWTFVGALSRFLDQTLSSTVISESVKTRRLVIGLNAADVTFSNIIRETLHDIISGRWHGVLQFIELGQYLQSRVYTYDRVTRLYGQVVVSGIIATVRERDERWFAIAMDQLGVSRSVLQDYVAHGNSVLLANLIHISRKILRTFEDDNYSAYISSRIIPSVSQFDVQNTLPRLQHDFCDLWNEIVLEAWNSGSDSTPIYILRYIRHLYVALHQGTIAIPTAFSSSTADHDDILSHGSSYPLCAIASHRPDISVAGVTPNAPPAT